MNWLQKLLYPLIIFSSPLMSSETTPIELVKSTLDVGIIVSDLDKAKVFYGEVLGFKPMAPIPLPDGTAITRFANGSSAIKLRAFPNASKYPGAVRKAVGFRLITFLVDDFDGILARVAAQGVPPPKAMEVGHDGMKYAFAADPDGNQIELVSLPPGQTAAGYDRIQVGLTVSDPERSRAFYGKILGFHEEKPLAPKALNGDLEYIFTAGKSNIKFWKGDGVDLPRHTGKIEDALGFRYFTFIVKDLDTVYAAAKASGAAVPVPPRELGKIARIMMLADPDGNWVEFVSIPAR
jgi:glyoxylase I family protein